MKTITSKPFKINVALEEEYRTELSSVCNKMLSDVSKKVVAIYTENKTDVAMDSMATDMKKAIAELQKKYKGVFDIFSLEAAKRMVMKQLGYARSVFKSAMEKLLPAESLSIKGSVIPKEMEQVIQASIMENVELIKSIPEKYFDRVIGSITRSMQAGGSIKQLKEELVKYNGMTRRQANIIANDQTKKTFTSINLRNFQKYGVEKAKWVHSGGGQTVREYHYRKWDGVSGKKDGRPNGLNGFIFDISKPPVIQKAQGKQLEIRGYPAQLPSCKCVMVAVIETAEI